MPVCVIDSGRFTSEKILIQYLPCGVAGDHVQHLYFQADVAAGTFKLRVNGNLTAAITFSAVAATLITAINAALDALPNLAPADIVASGADVADMTLTSAAGLGWFTILIEEDALTGNTSADPNVTTEVTTQGSKLYTLSAQASKFGYEVSTDTVEVTAMSEYEQTDVPVKESMTFDLSLYKSNEDWVLAVQPGNRGIMYVYDQGKVVGQKFGSFWALFDKASVTYPDHDVVEAEISGMRQGAMIVPFDSIYA